MRFLVLCGQLTLGAICAYASMGNLFELGWLLNSALSNLLLGVGMISFFSALYTFLGQLAASNKRAALGGRRMKNQ